MLNGIFLAALCFLFHDAAPLLAAPIVHLLAPGFDVQELPVKLSNINNLRFAPDGRLTALGYDGRVHLLRDTDGDGLEDQDELFWDQPGLSVPVGMAWAPEGLYVSSHGKVSLLRDTDGDGKADREEIIAGGWPPTDVASGGVDATAVTRDADGNLYFGLLVANYANAYRLTNGVPHYDIRSPRGTIQKWNRATRKLETICSGIRVPYTLAFNRAGDLFVTDQEGETWMPNGNPLDELNWILPGKNYGFPPRHDRYLPGLISEPPVLAFGPQHQSTCGLIFNDPSPGHPLFGPAVWENDAFIAGESRGKIWRVRLVKTPEGYVGKETILARLAMLTLDLAISPKGDLYVTCHSGQPDWGTGPNGPGKLFRIRFTHPDAPQPVAVWPSSLMEVRVAFDRPIDPSVTANLAGQSIEFGEYVRAADRWEVLKPPYEAVKKQEATPRGKLRIAVAKLSADGRTLILTTDPHPFAVKYALTLPGVKAVGSAGAGETVDLDYDFEGVAVTHGQAATESAPEEAIPGQWWPHPEWQVARAFLRGTAIAQSMAKEAAGNRTWMIRSDFDFPKGKYVLRIGATTPFSATAIEHEISKTAANGHELTQISTKQKDGFSKSETQNSKLSSTSLQILEVPFESTGRRVSLVLRFEKLQGRIPDVVRFSYRSDLDPTVRVVPISWLRVPWAPPHPIPLPIVQNAGDRPEDGDFERGKSLFFGERLKCATCHRIREEGGVVGPDLSTLRSRDVDSILRDIRDPSASIHPDYVAFRIVTKDGDEHVGFVRSQDETSVTVMGADARLTAVRRASIQRLEPSPVSLMPTGLIDSLKTSEVRDLLTFLCNAPPERSHDELNAIDRMTNRSSDKGPLRRLRIVLIASKQDHGPGQHDYPAWQRRWRSWLRKANQLEVTEAWEWPGTNAFQNADVLVFYYWNHRWTPERLAQLDRFLARGGGIVTLHSACIADQAPEQLSARLGLAAQPDRSKYRHRPVHLVLEKDRSPILDGLPSTLDFLDETYWPTFLSESGLSVLATAVEEGTRWPMLWTRDAGPGRVFGSILGHYTWTLDDPIFRRIILRGIAWTAHQPVDRFEEQLRPRMVNSTVCP